MERLFITVLNMSINATYLVIAVIFIKLVIKKSPRWFHCFLWALASARLIFPFSFKSRLSILPTDTPIPQLSNEVSPSVSNELIISDKAVHNPVTEFAPVNNGGLVELTFTSVASFVWIVGILLLLAYAFFSYIRIVKQVRPSVKLYDNVYLCDDIPTPFILGVFKPKIYIPSITPTNEHEMILAHERAHIKRRDNVWKPFAYILLTIYWFNPMLWIAYVLLSRDIELACDEKVIKNLSPDEKKQYSSALLNSSTNRRIISVCPLAFGETGVKNRIKNILNYKKPTFWIILISVTLSVVLVACFLTDPKGNYKTEFDNFISNIAYFTDIEEISAEIVEIDFVSDKPSITVRFSSSYDKEVIFGDSYYVYKSQNGEWVNSDRTRNDVWFAIGYPIVNDGFFEKTYSLATHDLDEIGEYKFETDFLVRGEGLDKDGVRQKYNIGFTFTLDTPIPYNEETISDVYNFNDAVQLMFMNSPDPFIPRIRLNRVEGTYMFTYSAFSSHVSIGEYDLFVDRLILREFGNDNLYTFARGEKGFKFVKSESAGLPEYSYSEGAQPQEPVPDGALFEWENSTNFLSNLYDTASADLDGDGIAENYYLSTGMTSGLFTFKLGVSEDEYKSEQTFRSEWVNPRFFNDDGVLKIAATTQSGTIFIWSVEFDGESLNIPQLYYESNPPTTAKVNYGYVAEVGENYEYIIVTEGENGYIHTNDAELLKNEFFKFYTDSQKTVFEVGDKVKIIHTGEFSKEEIPIGKTLSPIQITE